MEKTKVVIASILKPIDDTRMYEKFGLSLGQTNQYDINIIGFASKNIPPNKDISFLPLGTFPRMSWKRFFAPSSVWKKYLKVKPEVIIFNTHELLIVTVLYRIFFGAKIIYDIRENYSRNIRLQQVYPKLLRPLLASWIKLKERLSKPFIHRQIVAERSYLTELNFLKKNALLLENKFKPIAVNHETVIDSDKTVLLYSGTIAPDYGIFEAIGLVKKLFEINKHIRLKIIGYCAKKSDLIKLKEEIWGCDFIELMGGDHLVPHHEIVREIRSADYGIIMNRPNPVSDQKLPTRLFEYTANKLPILCIDNPFWLSFLSQFNAAIEIHPSDFNAERLNKELQTRVFYDKGNTESSFWSSETESLQKLVKEMTS